jgi:arrestin-related trafficking adapter 9
VISLEPYPKRAKLSTKSTSSKTKLKPHKENTDLLNDTAQTRNSPIPEESASQRPSSDQAGLPRIPVNSDVHSETSGESVVSSTSTGPSFRIGPSLPPVKSAAGAIGDIGNSSISSKTITATIELLKAGCLPGDSVPLRVSIQHTKFIKSVRGIIITLYRQSRIDSAPPLSLFTDVKGKAAEKLKHEEYYPKSKTGLGGLSLTSAGSSSVFRKDLSQTIAPIIIDPSTLSTVVTASIRIPDNVFPTITGVPGEMISFRYHIEVVIDLGGKLSGQSKHIPRLGMVNVPSNFMDNDYQMDIPDPGADAGILAAWGTSIINTDHIRREKSVVACLFEIIVGTTDSARLRGRGNTVSGVKMKPQVPEVPQSPAHSGEFASEYEVLQGHRGEQIRNEPNIDAGCPAETSQPEEEESSYAEYEMSHDPQHQSIYTAPIYVPMPEISPEEGLTEKERIHLAEQRLLPSQPLQDGDPSSSHAIVPSAPEDLGGDLYGIGDEPASNGSAVVDLGSELRNLETVPDSTESPSTPVAEDLTPQATLDHGEDKQELERRRLIAEASSPSDFPDDNANAGEESGGTQHQPTAPILTEEDEYGGHYTDSYGHHEGLPRYER